MEKLLIILILLMAGCGEADRNEPAAPSFSPSVSGVYFDSSVYDHAERAFSSVAACMEETTAIQFDQGNVNDLTLVIMLTTFDCVDATTGRTVKCNGQFNPPNTIRVSKDLAALKHEIAHYLFYVNTGDPDPIHSHKEVFTSCM